MNIGQTSDAIQDSPTCLGEQRSPDIHIVRSIEVPAISQEWEATIYINWMCYFPHYGMSDQFRKTIELYYCSYELLHRIRNINYEFTLGISSLIWLFSSILGEPFRMHGHTFVW